MIDRLSGIRVWQPTRRDHVGVTIAQFNPLVGDIEGNVAKLIRVLAESCAHRPDLVVLPEMYLDG